MGDGMSRLNWINQATDPAHRRIALKQPDGVVVVPPDTGTNEFMNAHNPFMSHGWQFGGEPTDTENVTMGGEVVTMNGETVTW